MSASSVEYYLGELLKVGVHDISEDLYHFFGKVDVAKLSQLLTNLDSLKASTTTLTGDAKKTWQAQKNYDVGKRFEEIIKTLFQGSSVFDVVTNLRTTTSDVDVTLTLKSSSVYVPFLRDHHTIYGESKCHTTGLKKEWIDEMRTTLTDHGAKLGIIFVYCTSRPVHRDARTSIGYGVVAGRVVIPFGKKQLNDVKNGKNLLSVLQLQHRDTITHNTVLSV